MVAQRKAIRSQIINNKLKRIDAASVQNFQPESLTFVKLPKKRRSVY